MRMPSFAGSFYEKGEMSLQKQLKACFESDLGPGATPIVKESQKTQARPKAVIVPHAGYQYSGACAAWSYAAIAAAPKADVYVILAPSHKTAKSSLSQEPFQTPLGIVRVDQDFARRILEKGHITEDTSVFDEEHAVEVQLPFLQYSFLEQRETLKILPMIISHDVDIGELSADIKEVMVETGKSVVFIVSTDFTHYGRNFKYSPFITDVQKNIAALDKGALDLISARDSEGFLKYIDDKMMTMCGVYPTLLMMKVVDSKDARLEQYYTSARVTKDEKNSVSYASMVFY